ncbi:hypothetical protein HMPREF0043_01040 [Actinobaculum sp. oral taxon 183 str. F0552]|nr:hypothetical protein HMPREF0043_01040 [Actinobaculum sp. oral taxon 183 str. F0552]
MYVTVSAISPPAGAAEGGDTCTTNGRTAVRAASLHRPVSGGGRETTRGSSPALRVAERRGEAPTPAAGIAGMGIGGAIGRKDPIG